MWIIVQPREVTRACCREREVGESENVFISMSLLPQKVREAERIPGKVPKLRFGSIECHPTVATANSVVLAERYTLQIEAFNPPPILRRQFEPMNAQTGGQGTKVKACEKFPQITRSLKVKQFIDGPRWRWRGRNTAFPFHGLGAGRLRRPLRAPPVGENELLASSWGTPWTHFTAGGSTSPSVSYGTVCMSIESE
jgi:hypothetical protein